MIGSTISHDEIIDKLGQGGMGGVFLARDTSLQRKVAVKFLPDQFACDPERLARFRREARRLASLTHPNVAAIYGLEEPAGKPFIVMELAAGETLEKRVERGPIPMKEALEICRGIAEGLEAAHERSIVHRDLKPSNIMTPSADRVKVVDFGLAKVAGAVATTSQTTTPLTSIGAIVGTAPYMSPEQATGTVVDARSDLFSLGTILYEMLAGRMPFRGDSAVGTLAAILKDTPAPIPGTGPEVARLVDRCLRKDPADRFQSATELKAAIEDCLAPGRGAGAPSIAVLPFTNMSGVKEDDYLCEGLAEEIIDALTRIPGLRVIARTSAFAVGRMGLDVREAGSRLDVGTILEGSVRRAGPRVRVTAQLVSTSDGAHVWSERYDRELTDVLQLEDEIAQAIAARLRVELAGAGRRQPPPVASAEAYTAYLEGRYYFARGTPDGLARAMASYERATSLDPGFALAYDSLAELYWYLGFFGNVPPREAFAVATFHALRALELDDHLAQTHALLGMLRKELDYNWPEVDRELRRARELNPEFPLVRLRYAISGLLPHGRVEEGLAEIDAMLRWRRRTSLPAVRRSPPASGLTCAGAPDGRTTRSACSTAWRRPRRQATCLPARSPWAISGSGTGTPDWPGWTGRSTHATRSSCRSERSRSSTRCAVTPGS